MGVERAVTRWHIQHQSITNEIIALEVKRAQIQASQQGNDNAAEIEKQLASLHDRLHALGPCPKPMMG
jgi:hypothetical protein